MIVKINDEGFKLGFIVIILGIWAVIRALAKIVTQIFKRKFDKVETLSAIVFIFSGVSCILFSSQIVIASKYMSGVFIGVGLVSLFIGINKRTKIKEQRRIAMEVTNSENIDQISAQEIEVDYTVGTENENLELIEIESSLKAHNVEDDSVEQTESSIIEDSKEE